MTEDEGASTSSAIAFLILGVVATLAAQVPTQISSPSYLWLMNIWMALTILSFLLLAIGAFDARGRTRKIGLILLGTAFLIAALSAGRYFSVLFREVF